MKGGLLGRQPRSNPKKRATDEKFKEDRRGAGRSQTLCPTLYKFIVGGPPPKKEPLQLAPSVGRVSVPAGATGDRSKAIITQKLAVQKKREKAKEKKKRRMAVRKENSTTSKRKVFY